MIQFHWASNCVLPSEFLSVGLKIFTAGTECATIEIERLKQYSKVCDSCQTLSICIEKAKKLLFGSYSPFTLLSILALPLVYCVLSSSHQE